MRARVISALLMVLALASPALAEDRRSEGTPSLDRVLPQIRRNTPGTFYDAEGPFPGPDGQARYRIKWMTPDGRIIWFDADAHTGRVLGGRPSGSRFRDERDDGFPPDRFGNRGWPDDRERDRDYNGHGRGDGGHDGRGGWSHGDRGGRGDRRGR